MILKKSPHIYIVGQTASGKTSLSLALSEHFGSEILNTDSLLFYKDLNIGTAKPSKSELLRVKHYMIDLCEVGEDINAADYSRQAIKVLEKSDKKFFCVGGSGFYIDALDKGLLPIPQTDQAVVKEVEALEDPLAELLKNDPESLKTIAKEDLYRVKRALQVFYQTGTPLSVWKAENKLESYAKKIALEWEKQDLLERVSLRTELMLKEGGIIEETKSALKGDRSKDWKPLRSVGYKETIDYLEGRLKTLDELKSQIITKTMQLAKRQKTWFKKDKSVKWFSKDESLDKIKEYVESLWENDQWRV